MTGPEFWLTVLPVGSLMFAFGWAIRGLLSWEQEEWRAPVIQLPTRPRAVERQDVRVVHCDLYDWSGEGA
jgi:hypothetical protein